MTTTRKGPWVRFDGTGKILDAEGVTKVTKLGTGDFALSDAREEMLTVEMINDRVAYIHSIRGDDEAAHSAEDRLYQDVLRAIAVGICDDPAGCAKAALESTKLDFARWCA